VAVMGVTMPSCTAGNKPASDTVRRPAAVNGSSGSRKASLEELQAKLWSVQQQLMAVIQQQQQPQQLAPAEAGSGGGTPSTSDAGPGVSEARRKRAEEEKQRQLQQSQEELKDVQEQLQRVQKGSPKRGGSPQPGPADRPGSPLGARLLLARRPPERGQRPQSPPHSEWV